MKPRLIALYFGLGLALSAGPAFATDLDDVLQFQRKDTAEMQRDHDASGMRDAQENVRAYQNLLEREQHAAPAPHTQPAPRTHHS